MHLMSGGEAVHLEFAGAKILAGTSRVVNRADITGCLDEMIDVARVALEEGDMVARGPAVAMPVALDADKVDLHVGFPVDGDDPGISSTRTFLLPGGRVATAWHLGARDDIDKTYERIEKWLHARGFEPGECPWEVLWAGWERNGARRPTRIQIAWPLA